MLESAALSAFCGSVATMLSAGIQTDESMLMLAENRKRSRFQEVCNHMYVQLANGASFSEAMESSEGFPRYAIEMAVIGERSGRLEQVLRNLEVYYDEEDRMFNKLRSSVGYPAALMTIMTGILLFTDLFILPVFANVYDNMAGSLAASSFISVGFSRTIGWVALFVAAVCALVSIALWMTTRNETGRIKAIVLFEKAPGSRKPIRQLALSRFASSLAACISSGITDEEALDRSARTVEHAELRSQVNATRDSLSGSGDPDSMAQVLGEQGVLDPLYARMLKVGIRSGRSDETLSDMSKLFFDDGVTQIDRMIDSVEPVFAAFLTVTVGFTIIAVMLPLIGMMGSIG